MFKLKLHWQVLIAMVGGCFLAMFFKFIQSSTDPTDLNPLYQLIVLFGTIFVRLLKMVMIPLIFTSIILGISSIGSRKKVGTLGIKTLIYYLSTSLLAIITGLTLSNMLKPGADAPFSSLLELASTTNFDPSKLQSP